MKRFRAWLARKIYRSSVTVSYADSSLNFVVDGTTLVISGNKAQFGTTTKEKKNA